MCFSQLLGARLSTSAAAAPSAPASAPSSLAPSSGSYAYTDRASTDRLSPTFNSFSHSLQSASSSPSSTPPSHPQSVSPISGSLLAPGAGAHSGGSSSHTQISNQAVTQLIDDLRNTDLQVRLNSFRKIQLISRALGAARTRGELIPYLGEFVDDDDELLLILAAHLGEMLDAVGGAEYAHVLLPPLEALAASDETAVREKAVASLAKIVEQANEHTLIEHVLPLLRRLATAEWFTGRISATALLPIVYPRLPGNPANDDSTRKELRSLFAHLCRKEETPMVKRAAAANLGMFASILDSKMLMSEFHSLLVRLSRDDVDSVRLLVVQSCVQIGKVYAGSKDAATRADNISKMKPIILSLSDDQSWRVRYMLADKFIELCATIAATQTPPSPAPATPVAAGASGIVLAPLRDDDLIACFMRLLEDPELEVRTSATLKCGEFARLLGPAKTMEKFFWVNPATGKALPPPALTTQQQQQQQGPRLPPLKSIVSDASPTSLHTKSALASIILQFTGVLSSAGAAAASSPTAASPGSPPLSANSLLIEHLLPLILNLLNDEHAEVRLGLIGKLGEEGAAQQAALASGGDKGPGANVLSIEVLSSSLLPALSKLASDPKWRVRLQTIHLMPNLAAFFQTDFFNQKLFDVVLAWLGDSIWSIREAAILNLVRLAQLFGTEWAVARLLPRIKALAMDKSYVFRLTSVFAMKELAPALGAAVVSAEMVPTLLQTLNRDVVPNVRFNVARLLGYVVKEGLVTAVPAQAAAGAAAAGSGGLATGATQQQLLESIEQALTVMVDDPDADVKFCAQQALKESFGK